jgi:MFS family permease
VTAERSTADDDLRRGGVLEEAASGSESASAPSRPAPSDPVRHPTSSADTAPSPAPSPAAVAPSAAAPPCDEPPCDPTWEDIEDADLEGDRVIEGGAIKALGYKGFRRVYLSSFGSNIGTWMQNVVLIAYATRIGGPSYAGIVGFAQLGPLLFVSLIGGSLADRFDRRKLLMIASLQQAAFAFALAWVARDPNPSQVLLVLLVFAIGMGQAIAGPTFSSVLPSLVEKKDLPGAVSLTSANMNLSRMIGAVLGAFVYAQYGVVWVFVANALTYFIIIGGVATVDIPRAEHKAGDPTGWRRVVSGFGIARRDPIILRVLVTLTAFSFCCLVFVVQMPEAAANFGLDSKSAAYGWLYATFAAGAFTGAISVGSVFVGRDLGRLVRIGLIGFSACLTAYSLWRTPAPAYPTAFLVGFFYFLTITSLSTILQGRLDNNNRGRVMAIWIMAFGGTVPIGALVAGPLIERFGMTDVMLFGALAALALVPYARVRHKDVREVEAALVGIPAPDYGTA